MNTLKAILIAFLLFSAGITAHGQQKWTLRECIDYAIEHNIEVKQYEVAVEESQVYLRNYRGARLPEISASLGQSFNFGRSLSNETNLYESAQSSHTNIGASGSVPLFQGGTIKNNIKSGKLNLQAAIAGLESVKENLELQITNYYLDVLYRKELLGVYEMELELSRQQMERAGVLVEAGMTPRTEYLESRSQVAQNQVRVVTAEGELETAILNLRQALNLDIAAAFDIVHPDTESIAIDQKTAPDPNIIYGQALAVKPHIRELEYRLESSQYGVKAARGSLFPSISLGASYSNGYQYRFNNPNLSMQYQLRNFGSEYVGLSINIPIYNRGQTRNNIRLAGLTVRNRELNLENMKQDIYKEIQQASLSLRNAIAEHEATEMAVEAAEEAFNLTNESFSLGKATAIELAESRSLYITSMSSMVRAKYQFLFRSKILDFYKGVPISL